MPLLNNIKQLKETFAFTFNFKFLAQEPVYFFFKCVVSLPVFVYSLDRTRTESIDGNFKFLLREPA